MTWHLKKRDIIVVHSNVEAEYDAMTYGVNELLWLKQLLSWSYVFEPLLLLPFRDNKSTINIANNLVQHN